jgi:hypothetical protein
MLDMRLLAGMGAVESIPVLWLAMIGKPVMRATLEVVDASVKRDLR